jgi:hypothetical protein
LDDPPHDAAARPSARIHIVIPGMDGNADLPPWAHILIGPPPP